MSSLLTMFTYSGGAAPPPPAFAPTDISNIAAWYDASDTATITQSGGLVSQWNDKSGNGYHAVQATSANQPMTGTRTLNSKNVLDFDGTNDYLTLPSGLYSVPAGANTVFFLFATDSSGVQQRLLQGGVAAATRWGVLYLSAANQFNALNNTTFLATASAITPNTSPHIGMLNRSGSSVASYYDGAAANSAGAVNVTLDAIMLGTSPGLTQYLDGIVGEVLIYAKALSTAEMNQVGNYLSAKWGTTWNTM